MKNMNTDKLKKRYEDVCNEYVDAFVKKQGVVFDGWVGDDIGSIAGFCEQYFFSLSDIVWDINANCPKGLILKWQEDCVSNPERSINYYSYSKGLRIVDKNC